MGNAKQLTVTVYVPADLYRCIPGSLDINLCPVLYVVEVLSPQSTVIGDGIPESNLSPSVILLLLDEYNVVSNLNYLSLKGEDSCFCTNLGTR